MLFIGVILRPMVRDEGRPANDGNKFPVMLALGTLIPVVSLLVFVGMPVARSLARKTKPLNTRL